MKAGGKKKAERSRIAKKKRGRMNFKGCFGWGVKKGMGGGSSRKKVSVNQENIPGGQWGKFGGGEIQRGPH